jgi:hypothetical protein
VLVAAVLGPPCVVAVAVGGELSAPALVAVLGTGSVLAAVGMAGRSGAGAAPVGRRGAAWLVWVVSLLAWELLTLASDAMPTLSDLADPVLAHPVPRGAATAAWLAAGVWLLARPSDGLRR